MLVFLKILSMLAATMFLQQEPLGEYWGTAEEEAKYYKLVDIPLPKELAIEAGSFEVMPDKKRLAIGTRRGDIFLADGAFDEHPEPKFHKFASGLDEVFGMAYRDGSFLVTQQTEVTRITDVDGDDRADKFETLNDDWGFRHYHEFAFGSKPDPEGNIWVTLCLSKSYNSWVPFRGWCLKITPEGKAIPICSGIRSPCGIGPNETGEMFYAESQGPWNGSCSLKVLQPGGFMGHPVSFNWYDLAPSLGKAPVVPDTPSRLETERKRVKELVPYAVVFPYKRMGRSISGFEVNRTGGKFGPFENQLFVSDFSLGVILRATTEKVNGVWQGACYPFREGFDTGLLAVQFTPDGNLIAGGTNRGWPVRGPKAYAVQRLDWTGKVPFEIKTVNARPKGFKLTFTKAVDPNVAGKPGTYQMKTFTHIYRQGYGSPEVDQTEPKVTKATVADDGMSVLIEVDGLVKGHVHDLYLPEMRSAEADRLVHANAYYTLNEIPGSKDQPVESSMQTPPQAEQLGQQVQTDSSSQRKHPVPESDLWLTYSGKSGPGLGKHVVLIAADQEYRSEQSMPMLAKVLSEHHGFDCTVLFSTNKDGLVDPTIAIKRDSKEFHRIPGLEHLAKADAMIFLAREMRLDDDSAKHVYDFFDTGKPMLMLRTGNHGINRKTKPYKLGDQPVSLERLLGGKFRGHHGGWHREATRGVIVDEQKSHPVLIGVSDIWGPSDVYRCHNEKFPFPEDCTKLVLGQPCKDLNPDSPPNLKKEALPIAWVKKWKGNQGLESPVFHFTMGSGRDFLNAGVRRITVNALYWGLGMESKIDKKRSVEIVGEYQPLKSGFKYDKIGVKPRKAEFYK